MKNTKDISLATKALLWAAVLSIGMTLGNAITAEAAVSSDASEGKVSFVRSVGTTLWNSIGVAGDPENSAIPVIRLKF